MNFSNVAVVFFCDWIHTSLERNWLVEECLVTSTVMYDEAIFFFNFVE